MGELIHQLWQFYRDHEKGINLLLVIVGIIATGIGSYYAWAAHWVTTHPKRIGKPLPSLPFKVIKPNGNVFTEVFRADNTYVNPVLADQRIPYQHRVAEVNHRNRLYQLLEKYRWLLITGRTGLGKTREAAEIAQFYNRQGWTVLVLSLGEWLGRPTTEHLKKIGTDRKLLFLLDDLNQYIHRSYEIEQNPEYQENSLAPRNIPLQERLLQVLTSYEEHFANPEDVRVIATVRDEQEEEEPGIPSPWQKLQWEKYPQLWRRFYRYSLPEPELGAVVEVIRAVIPKTAIQVDCDLTEIARRNDGTFRNVVENLVKLDNQGLPLNVQNYQDSLKGTWKQAYKKAVRDYPLAVYVYDAIDLLQQCDIPLSSFLVTQIAGLVAGGNFVQQILYRFLFKQVVMRLNEREGILRPRDGQIEGKGNSVELMSYWQSLSQLVWRLSDQNPVETESALFGLSLTAHKLKRYQEALEGLNHLVRMAPNDPDYWFYQGTFLGNLGSYKEAITSFDKVISIDHNNYMAWFNRGIALGLLGRNKEAITAFNESLTINSNDYEVWYYRGIALGNLGKLEEAIADYDKAISLNGDDDKAWNNRGVILAQLGRDKEAIMSYDQAIKIRPNDYKALNNRGIALANLGRYEEAIIDYNKNIDIEPDKPHAYYLKSCAYALQKNVPLAIENLIQAIMLDSKYLNMAKNDTDFDKIRVYLNRDSEM